MKFRTPKGFKDVTIEQYIDLLELNPEDFESTFEYRVERISIILNEDADQLGEELTIEELTDLNNSLNWINGRIKGDLIEDWNRFKLKPFNSLTLGEFIDLENLLSKGYYLNAKKILAILYRRFEVDKFNNEVFEPYKFDLNNRAEFFNDFRVNNAQGVLEKYLKFREYFLEKRKKLFKSEDKDEDEKEEGKQPKTREEIEEEKREEIFERWSWEFLIYKLCKGDLTKVEEVTELSLILVFNFEAMKKELNIKDF